MNQTIRFNSKRKKQMKLKMIVNLTRQELNQIKTISASLALLSGTPEVKGVWNHLQTNLSIKSTTLGKIGFYIRLTDELTYTVEASASDAVSDAYYASVLALVEVVPEMMKILAVLNVTHASFARLAATSKVETEMSMTPL
jgi:hypothetical protein